MLPFEKYYEKLLEAHVQTGHGGRDRIFHNVEKKFKISRNACAIFVSLCESCNRKKGFARKGLVVKPIITNGFNVRCQIDLIDFQSCKDGKIENIMNLLFRLQLLNHTFLICRGICIFNALPRPCNKMFAVATAEVQMRERSCRRVNENFFHLGCSATSPVRQRKGVCGQRHQRSRCNLATLQNFTW